MCFSTGEVFAYHSYLLELLFLIINRFFFSNLKIQFLGTLTVEVKWNKLYVRYHRYFAYVYICSAIFFKPHFVVQKQFTISDVNCSLFTAKSAPALPSNNCSQITPLVSDFPSCIESHVDCYRSNPTGFFFYGKVPMKCLN